jgi:two-component system NarL family sensor kinase
VASSSEVRQRNRELSILNQIARALNGEIDLARALHTTLALVAELLDLHTGWVWLLDEQAGTPYLAASQSLPPALAHSPNRMRGTCYCLDTYRQGDLEGAANVNVVTCSRLYGLVDGTDGLRYHASIPLYAHGKRLGVLNVASPDWRELKPEELRLLYTVGDLLSIAIERARLFAHSAQIGAVEERNRLAREIHDTLAQGLAAIALQLETADALLEGNADRERIQQVVRQALTHARESMEDARRSVHDLRAASLEGRSLDAALEALAREQADRGGFKVTLDLDGHESLPRRVENGLYRAAQEALNNVTRHARARHVTLRLAVQADRARLTVEDDGVGFDPADVPTGRFGLAGLTERARLLGGRLEVESSPGQGTRLSIEVPTGHLI